MKHGKPMTTASQSSHAGSMQGMHGCLTAWKALLTEDVYEQASIQYHSIRDLAAYTTPRAGLSLWHMLFPLARTLSPILACALQCAACCVLPNEYTYMHKCFC